MAQALASPLPGSLASALRKREQFYISRQLTFRVSVRHDISRPKPIQNRMEYLLEVKRAREAVQVQKQPRDGREYKTEQGNTVQFSLKSGPSSICHVNQDVKFVVQPGIVLGTDMSVAQASMLAEVKRGNPSDLYGNPETPLFICEEIANIRGVCTIGLDVSKLYQAKWEHVKEKPDRWVLLGKIKAHLYDPTVSGEYPDVSIRVELAKPDALPLQLEILRPLRAANKWQRSALYVDEFKKVGSIRLPSKFRIISDSSSGHYKVVSVYELVRFDSLDGDVELEMPIGTDVVDWRIGQAVKYSWQGRLPTEEELKKLAFQQGYLLPAESPRRRYSPWLFVPALVFFAAAGYLYWKQRRK